MRWAALVLGLLLVGCVKPAEPAASAEPAPLAAASTPAVEAFVAPPVPELPIALALADTWIRPKDMVYANATASASSFEWYLATRNPLAQTPDAGPFLIPPEGRITLSVREAGRHAFALEGSDARFNVSVLPGSIPIRLDVALVEDDGALRFAPEELVGGAGSVVRLTNAAEVLASVRRTDAMVPLDGSRAQAAFLMPFGLELGDYDVVVVARDGAGSVGVASARLVYDNRKPDPAQTFGPFVGSFRVPPIPETQSLRHDWENAHPLATLDMTLDLSSSAPVPARLRATLLDAEGSAIGAIESGDISFHDLPPGDYTVLVEQLEGALVEYSVELHGVWTLVPPTTFFTRD